MRRPPLLLLASLFLIVLGARAAVIGYAGSQMPFLDEWDGDAAQLLIPYLQGRLTLGDLVAPFAEHRIVFTRLGVLFALWASGYWDVVLQMIVNAIVDSATVVAVSYALSRVLEPGRAVAATIACALINAIPYAYDTILFGFHTQFFALKAFSFASLWLLAGSKAWSPRWAGGVFAAVGAFLSMASGAVTPAAAAAVHCFQAVCRRRRGLSETTGIGLLVALTIAMAALIPQVSSGYGHEGHSVSQFLSALAQLMSWPANTPLGLVFFVPSAAFVARALLDRPALDDPRWLNIALLAWVVGQMVAIAAARGEFPGQTRYNQVLLVGAMINFISGVWWFQHAIAARGTALWRSLAFATWLAVFALFMLQPQRHLPEHLKEYRTMMAAGADQVRSYLATGNASYVSDSSLRQGPYLDGTRLGELLDAPEIRAVLPPDIVGRAPPRPWVEAVKGAFLRLGPVWLAVGALGLAAALGKAHWAFLARRRLIERALREPADNQREAPGRQASEA